MLNVRNHLRKSASIAAATAVTVVATAGIAMASASGPAITSPETIKLHLHGGSVTFINIRHKKGFLTGDEFIGAQPATSPAHPAQVIGHAYVTITLITKSTDRVQATLVLRQGQIDLSGIDVSDPFELAVTGGTGAFANARGEATIDSGNGKSNPATITLSLLP
jgi:hypothetical protein